VVAIRKPKAKRRAARLLPGKVIAVDTETDGLNVYRGHRPFLIVFANTDGETHITWCDNKKEMALVRQWMADPSIVKIFHNAKFDLKMLAAVGVQVKGRIHDTMILGHMLSAQGPAGPDYQDNCLARLKMEVLAAKFLPDQRKLTGPADWIKQHRHSFQKEHGRPPNYSDVPRDLMDEYARQDALITLQLFYLFFPHVKRLNLKDVYDVEMELLRYIIEMEDRGVIMDIPFMKRRVVELTNLADASEKKLREMCKPITKWRKKTRQRQGQKYKVRVKEIIEPKNINFNSDPQMQEVIYGQLKLPVVAKTKSGAPSLDERALSRHKHPFTKELIRWRQYIKVRDTYFIGYQERMVDGVLHPNYAQQGTQSGRFSSSDPNLQNIPMESQVRERAGADVIYKGVKRAFIPRKGFTNWHFDYSQIELRLFAHESRDKRVVDVMTSGRDLHDETCIALYGKLDEKLRVLAKIVNFGILYGMGRKTFAWKLKCTQEKVEELLQMYYNNFPGVRDFQQRVISQVRSHGYIHNWAGRRYHINPQFAYKGVNYLCQGGAADVLKRAMVRVGRFLKGLKSNMIMTIHDEIVVEVHESEKHFVPKAICRIMMHNPQVNIPLKVSAERADGSWDTLTKVKLTELGLPEVN